MPNHTVLRELSTTVHATIRRPGHQESRFQRLAQGYTSCQDIVARTFFQIRERPELEFPAQVPAFFRRNARNRLISRRGDFQKKKKKKKRGRRWTNEDGQASERTNEPTNEGSGGSCCGGRRKRRKKGARQSAFAFTRFSARFVLSAVLPVSSLFPPVIGWSRNGRIKER